MRGLDIVRPVAGNPILAKVINHDEEDVGFLGSLGLHRTGDGQHEQQENTFNGIDFGLSYFQVFSLTGLPLVVRIWKW